MPCIFTTQKLTPERLLLALQANMRLVVAVQGAAAAPSCQVAASERCCLECLPQASVAVLPLHCLLLYLPQKAQQYDLVAK